MPTEFPGDATEEDIKKQLHKELRGQLTGVSGEKQVTVNAATAALLLSLLPEPPPEEEPKKASAPRESARTTKG